MQLMRNPFLYLAISLLVSAARAAEVVTLSACDDTSGWPPAVKIVGGGPGHERVVAYDNPGQLAACNLDFRSVDMDITEMGRLTFWYRVEGSGLRSLMVKVVAYPLAGGMQATWPVADSHALVGKWRMASVDLQHPTYIWGDKPSRHARVVMFRVDAKAPVRVLLDDVCMTPALFDAQVGRVQMADGSGGKVKFVAPLHLRSLTEETLSLRVSVGGRTTTRSLTAGTELNVPLDLSVDRVAFARLAPLQARKLAVAVAADGAPWSRREFEVELRKPMKLPPHPRLLLRLDDIPRIRDKARRFDWARKAMEALVQRADQWLLREIVLPPRGSQWWHWYSCKQDGGRLSTESPTRHVCTVCGKVYSGWPYDDVVLARQHNALSNAVRDLGLVYQLTGKEEYAAKARQILLAYADKYLTYPLHNIHGRESVGGGRVGPQSLDESTWLIPVAQGADLVWETLSQQERATLRDKLFLPCAVEVIQKHRISIHNIQCWKNSAVGLTGLLLGDDDLVADAYSSDHGYLAQMREGVTADGQWFEGAWGYHFYTLSAVLAFVIAGDHCGLETYLPQFKGLFDAPLRLAMPDLRLPAFNDSGSVLLTGQASRYEVAYAHFRDDGYLRLLGGHARQSLEALLYGVAEDLPSAAEAAVGSGNHAAAGYAVFHHGQGKEATWLALDYGPHGGGHGHPDKLGFVFYARGRVLADDPGTAHYGVPIQKEWYRTTLAHNTLTVDESSQRPTTGACEAFLTHGSEVSAALANAGAIYPGVQFRRAVAMFGRNTVLFIDLVEADKEHVYDMALHCYGEWSESMEGSAWQPPAKPGYQHVRNARVAATDQGGALVCDIGDGLDVTCRLASGEETEIIQGDGVGRNTRDRVPVVIARRRARNTTFAWALVVDDQAAGAALSRPDVTPSGESLRWRSGSRSYLMVVNPKRDHVRCQGWESSAPLFCVVADENGERAFAPEGATVQRVDG